eukprot:scaffold5.g800.t1
MGTAGDKFIDIRRLQPTTGLCTFDPGFGSTASCESSITYIDGGKGVLLYRGYTVMFALARTVGWVAQWKEMASEAGGRITRPRQIYTGNLRRKYIPVYERQLRRAGKIALPDKGVAEGGFRSSLMSRLVSADARPAGR